MWWQQVSSSKLANKSRSSTLARLESPSNAWSKVASTHAKFNFPITTVPDQPGPLTSTDFGGIGLGRWISVDLPAAGC